MGGTRITGAGVVLGLSLVAAVSFAADGPPHEVVVDSHRRYDPGLGFSASAEGRSYEGLSGAGAALGLGLRYDWDLVGVALDYRESLVEVTGSRPGYLELAADYAFITYRGVSATGRAGVALMFDPPTCQLAPLAPTGAVCSAPNPGPMVGPDLALGVRYRWSPSFDVFANVSADILKGLGAPRQFFFNPGIVAGVTFHPFGREN